MRIEPGLEYVSRALCDEEADLPRFGECPAGANDETSSNSTSDSNHSNVTRLESTVQMRIVGVHDGAIAVGDELTRTHDASVRALLAVLGV
jgi:hypothetical protein